MTQRPTTVAEGIQALVDADKACEAAEAALKAANSWYAELQELILPDLFDRAGEMEATLPNGAKAKMGMLITGSLPKVNPKDPPDIQRQTEETRRAALDWLFANDCGPMIKCEVRAVFDKGDAEKAAKLAAEIQRNDNSVVVKLTEDIHPQTLQAEVRRRLTAGKAVPTDTLGIRAIPGVKLTKKPKES